VEAIGAQATEDDTLTFVGRFSRREEIALLLYLIFRNRRLFYRLLVTLSLCALAIFVLASADSLQHYLPKYSVALRIGYAVSVGVLTILVSYLARVLHVLAKACGQEEDSTIKLSAGLAAVSRSGNSESFEIADLIFKCLPMGLGAVNKSGRLVFVLPFRVISPDQRLKLERMYKIRLG
jgi:hypothetical protein